MLRVTEKRTREYKARTSKGIQKRLSNRKCAVIEMNNKWAKGYVLESESSAARSQ